MFDELVQELSGRSVLHAFDGLEFFFASEKSVGVVEMIGSFFRILRVFVLSVV